jgi:superfamily I DNA/RNA helicase/Zn-dependent peptidase ImmA (M78 family)
MDSFGAVRKLAREKHAEMKSRASGSSTAAALLAAARAATNAAVQAVSPEHPLLAGGDGALHRNGPTPSIYLSSALPPEVAAYVEAHEFGHLWIETPTEPAVTPRNSDPAAPEENTPLGLRRVEAYSPEELRERYANVFGREFLLPCPEAKRLFGHGRSARHIAAEIGVQIGLVNQQLAAALLLPDPPAAEEEAADRERPGLDESQKTAAEHEGSPLLVEAGPGTGKTRTLIARVEYLLAKNVPAPSILALTFSNKAAREIRERVAGSVPGVAPEIWAGTFHAFGLEFLRKFGHLDGIAEPVRLLDQADQLALLERELPRLGLDHYLLLHEPLFQLRNIIGAISRAKDEVFSPQSYADAATRMLSKAGFDEELRLRAEKAAEVARVYAHYDACLRVEGIVDFADLINRPIEILRKHPKVRDELRGQYMHILVDEYQDVNRASALLLKELVGEGERLWVVGDARQSIYRFRGAAPSNTTDFEKDYPNGKRLPLAVNYRSRKQIVDTFGTYASRMSVGRGRKLALLAHRGAGADPINYNVAPDRSAEIAGIATAIGRQRSAGRAYRDQAVLCRSHSNLQKIATGLEAAGIPVLYLGDLFERPEVRDLLSLLSFVSERHRGGLLRVANLPRYRMPLADVRTFLAYAGEAEKTPLVALADAGKLNGLSAVGKDVLARLRSDLDGVGFKTGPGQFLCDLLFERGLIRDYLPGDTAADHQRRLAIHQFLQFAVENDRRGEGDPKRRLLGWVRRLEVFGDERALREPPAAVEGIDAVRLLTVHASKGLEFDVVHLPTLGKGIFPLSWSGQVCPAPDGMLSTSVEEGHAEEEQCLFFVAVSRARDHLSLSRAQRYSDSRGSNPSPALDEIAGHLPRAPDSHPTWTTRLPTSAAGGSRPDLKRAAREHDGRDIELYLDCPRRYLYQTILGLSGSREDNGYVRFHRAVYRVLRWMAEQTGAVAADALKAETDARWAETGPTDHPLQPLYRASAQKILDQANARPRGGIRFGETLTAMIDGHVISLSVDEIQKDGSGFVIRRLRTGKAPKKKQDHRVLHALMAEAGRQAFGAGGRFEIRYLSSDDAVPISFTRVMSDRLDETRAAIAGLAAGSYPAIPSDNCPRCPHYFICQAVPD